MTCGDSVVFFFKQKTAYEITVWLEFRRVLFRSEGMDVFKFIQKITHQGFIKILLQSWLNTYLSNIEIESRHSPKENKRVFIWFLSPFCTELTGGYISNTCLGIWTIPYICIVTADQSGSEMPQSLPAAPSRLWDRTQQVFISCIQF